MKIILQIALITFYASCVWVQGQTSPKYKDKSFKAQPEILTLCELINNPEKFHDKIVSVRAIFFSNYENTGLYDSKCRKKDNVVWLDMNCGDSLEKCSEKNSALTNIPYSESNGNKERKVLLTGVFKYYKLSNKRFGVNLRAKYALELIEIEDTFPRN